MAPWTALTVLALAGLLAAEHQGSAWGKWVAKPLASAGFVGAAVAAGAPASAHGRVVLVALVLCWLGDVLLIPRSRRAFAVGLLAFLSGHLAYAVAFAVRGLDLGWVGWTALLLVVPGAAAARWLWPHAGRLRGPVLAYVAVISLMVASAAGAAGAALGIGVGRGALLLVGALAFYLSDLLVARNRFVTPGFVNRAIGLPLYYGAQLLLATSE